MIKLPVLNSQKKKLGERQLPVQFGEQYRPDLIRRVVHALESNTRQPYGTSPEAGLRHSSSVSKRRRDYKGCYGFGISRVNRKVLSRRGTRMNWVGAFSPQTRGGRRAHPPKAERIWLERVNKKENRKAIRSAISATINKVLVQQRGHFIPEEYPFLLTAEVENIDKTAKVAELLESLGFVRELERSALKKVRAGKGKMRGRRYRRKKGVLLVVGQSCPLLLAAKNIPGLDIVPVHSLNARLLAPGALPGRVTLWTEKAIEEMDKHHLFV